VIRLTGTITYADGTARPVEVVQVEFAAWELHALRSGIPVNPEGAPPITMLRYLGYAATQRGKPEREWTDYEEWNAGVLDVELEGDVDPSAGVPAFPPVRSAG
jgi:hypothetical protein